MRVRQRPAGRHPVTASATREVGACRPGGAGAGRRSVVPVRAPVAVAVAAVLAAIAALAASAVPAHAAEPPRVVAIRAANAGALDRVVFEFDGDLPAEWTVTRADELVAGPSGRLVPIAGTGRLRLRMQLVDWFTLPQGGSVTTANVTEVRLVSAFEGVADYGIGLRDPASFRTFTLTAPNRIVIDIDAAPPAVDDPALGRFYAVSNAGEVRWYDHAAPITGAPWWTVPNFGNRIGEGFGAPLRLFAGGNGVVYGLDDGGNLHWYRHADPASGSAWWVVPNFGAVVATGWTDVRTIVGMEHGVLYVVADDGTLRWYRHRGALDGTARWFGPEIVGNGFDRCDRLLRGDLGVLYCVRDGGLLQYWRHLDVLEGVPVGPRSWLGGNVVGTGWGSFAHLWGTRGGVLYAVEADGRLRWFRHRGSQTGTDEWEVAGFGRTIGAGWTALRTVLSAA